MLSNTSKINLCFKETEQCYLKGQKLLKTNLKPRRNPNSGFPAKSFPAFTLRCYRLKVSVNFIGYILRIFNQWKSFLCQTKFEPSFCYLFSADLTLVMRRTCWKAHVDFRRHSAASLQRSEFCLDVASLTDTSGICFSSATSKEMQVFILLFLDFFWS